MTILSILIPSIPEHFSLLEKLIHELHTQVIELNNTHPTLGGVEVLVDNSLRFLDGGLSIGKKREGLYKRANGLYACCVDADDWVAPNYIESIVRLCNENKDVVTFRNLTKTDNYWCVVDMSLNNPENEEANPDRIVKRRPWHICPVKSEFAKLYDFEDTNYGEDFNWMEKVLTHCEIEAKTNQILHCYNHSSKTSEADKITRKELENHTSKMTKDELEYFTIHGKFK